MTSHYDSTTGKWTVSNAVGMRVTGPDAGECEWRLSVLEARLAGKPDPERPNPEWDRIQRNTKAEYDAALQGRKLVPMAPQQDSIQARFERFHAANPHIYARLVEAARRLMAAGKTKIGIGHLVEDVVRWAAERTISNENYKISNDYRSRYARLIMEQEPDLRGVFEIRQLESA